MKIAILGFSPAANRLCVLLCEGLKREGHECRGFVLEKYASLELMSCGLEALDEPVSRWTGNRFEDASGIIFIGAVGIAVRMAAPYIRDKAVDPAVVSVDEMGAYVIPLLSGHLGGANDLARGVAGMTGGVAVITTATDIHGKFAVDLYARDRGLILADRRLAKEISADVLAGVPVGLFSDFPVEKIPEGVIMGKQCRRNIWITAKAQGSELPDADTLKLIAPVTVLGIGCRRGVPGEEIACQVEHAMNEANLARQSICAVGTIDLKKEEPGLLEYVTERKLPLLAFSAELLSEVEGEFTKSVFVTQVTGVDNVCERAALAACRTLGQGKILVRKQAGKGVTVAIARIEWKA